MSWPLSQDYNEAIQSPKSSFSDAHLRGGEAVCNALGLPMPYSGNFADVYQVRCPDGSRWAVKCFTREVPGLRERYQKIGAHLAQAKLPFMVDFSYLDQGIRVGGQWFPVLKMQWVEGLTLNQFVGQYLDRPARLEALAHMWARMGLYLRAARVAHCDLQHGNVLLVPGADSHSLKLKLIDYDGMWVPDLAGTKSGEVGHPSYQHPQRLREQSYHIDVDRFPLLLIATALRALKARGKELWDKYDNGDNLLFKEPDLREPLKSYLFLDLTKTDDAVMKPLVDHLIKALRGGLETTPLLEELMPDAKAGSTPAPPTRRSKLGGPPSGAGLNKSGTTTAPVAPATTSSRPSRLAPPAPPAAPAAPAATGALDFDELSPGLVKRAKGRRNTKRSPGAPKRGRMGAVVAAVVVIGLAGGLAFWFMRGLRKDTKQGTPATPIVLKDAETLPSQNPEPENPPPPDKPAELTQEAFDKIDKDMTKDDVVKLLGPSVHDGEPFVLGTYQIVASSWRNAGKQVQVVLTQGKVTNKSNDQGWPVVWPGEVVKNPPPSPPAPPPPPPSEGFTPLFDGKDLMDWSVETGSATQWRVEDEEIVGKSDDLKTRSYLLTTKEYSDFILRLEYKLDPDSGGGLTFRALDGEKLPLDSGEVIADHPLIKITDPGKFPNEPSGTTHWVKDDKTYCKPVEDVKPAAGEWHRMEVTVRGDGCSALLDEKKVVELHLDAGENPAVTPALKRIKGRLGFQVHTGTIRFRNIEIKDLTAMTPETTTTPDDPIQAKLDKAKAAFDAAVEKYQQKVHVGLDKVEESATKAGNKDLVAPVQAEREAFDESGDLPKSLPSAAEFKRDEDEARSILDSAYAAAIKAYTNGKMEAKADPVKEERKEFQQGHPTDAFRVGSVWKGKAVQIWVGHPDTSVTDCSLTVLERDDKSFKATVEEQGNTLEVQGSMVRGAIRWLAKDVRVIKGGPEHDTEGKVKGNVVELQSGWIGNYRGKSNATVLTVQLRLQKK